MSDLSATVPHRSRIYLAGHRGMVGSAIHRLLIEKGYQSIVTRTSEELDLTNQSLVEAFFKTEKIEIVILAAARVGGIGANVRYPAEFIYVNQMIQNNVIHQAFRTGVSRLLFLGSSCIYPKFAPQPMSEEYLLTGTLEQTNEPYAIAKIGGIKMCEAYNRQYGTDFRAVMPTNLYGPGDNFNLENSHVIPAIMRKYHLAKLAMSGNLQAIEKDYKRFGSTPPELSASLGLNRELAGKAPYVMLWGSGRARREFLHVDDMAAGCLHVLNLSRTEYLSGLSVPNPGVITDRKQVPPVSPNFYNIGAGKDCTIREAAEIIRGIVGYEGETRYDSNQPDGTPQKLLDITRISKSGWYPRYTLEAGLQDTYEWYCRQTQIR